MTNLTTVSHAGPVCFTQRLDRGHLPVGRLDLWEPRARALQSEEDLDVVMEALRQHDAAGGSGELMFRAVETRPDGSRHLVEMVEPVDRIIDGNESCPRDVAKDDVIYLVDGFYDHLEKVYPGRSIQVEVVVGHSFRHGALGRAGDALAEAIGAESLAQMGNLMVNKSEVGDPVEYVAGLGAISGQAQVSTENGRFASMVFTPHEILPVVVNVHALVASADGSPVHVPEVMQGDGMTPAKFAMIMRDQRNLEEMRGKIGLITGDLVVALRTRGLPGWEEDADYLTQKVKELDGVSGLKAMTMGRRMLNQLMPLLEGIQEDVAQVQSASEKKRLEDRALGRGSRANSSRSLG